VSVSFEATRFGPQHLIEAYARLVPTVRRTSRLRRGIGRDSYAEGVINNTEFEPRIAALKHRMSKLQERHQSAREAAACRTSFAPSAESKSTTAAWRSSFGSRHQTIRQDQDHRPKQPVLGNIVQALVERTIAWLNRCRRLAKDWENLNRSSLAFLKLASIRLMLRNLCNP
jgi:transposase